jgi:Tol biopolymer transport system component
MALAPGTRLGPYEILSLLGAGGMGEVYKARDTRLGRDVALKILPQSFTHDPDRIVRFRREAQLLAALNHPHIAQIHGLDEANGTQFLVLELVDGEGLDKRIARGPIPFDDALGIAAQVADALDAAHERGIIHRDLKPANIALTKSGQVKVLDFGLAKATEAPSATSSDLTNSPTIMSHATMTGVGVILGTAAYMSPEQAKGRAADKRSDIWAFGCVLFEMLTGKHAFECGDSVSDAIAAVLKNDPDWKTLAADTPITIRRLLRRCLEKDRAKRLDSAADARLEIDDVGAEPAERAPVVSSRVARLGKGAAWAVGAMTVVAIILVAALWVRWSEDPKPIRRFAIDLEGALMVGRSGLAISPDATHLVYAANQQLYVRAMDQLVPAPIKDTVGAQNAFFSPDSQWIGFWQNNRLKKVPLSAGATFELCPAPNPIGVSWSPDGMILYGALDGIYQVSSNGGEPKRIIAVDPQKEIVNSPRMLPDDKTVLFSVASLASGRLSDDLWDSAQIVAAVVGSSERKVIAQGGRDARYLPTGHLVYVRKGALLAVPFNLKTLTARGSPIPVVDGIQQGVGGVSFGSVTGSNTQLSISDTGVLVYVPVDIGALNRTLTWVDRHGREAPLRVPNRAYVYPRISPDGRRLALDIRDQERDIWIWDFARETMTRFTFDSRADTFPVWTRDGTGIFWSRVGKGVFAQDASGSGSAERLIESGLNVISTESLSPDGTRLVFNVSTAQSYDIRMLDLASKQVDDLLAQPGVNELNAEVSPDGRWLTYASDESGHYQVYVCPFPKVSGGKWQISESGGTRPLWSPDGKELFYLAPPDGMPAMMAVSVDTASTFHATNATRLFSGPYFTALNGRTYDISPDGQRFLMVKAAGEPAASSFPKVVVIENWFEELQRRVPTK